MNIANKFQDCKEKNPTRKDKMSTLGNQYFKLKMFRYKGVFCFNFEIIKNPSSLKWKWSPSRGCHSSYLNKNIASLKKKVAYCKVPKVGTNSWGSFFARSGKKWTLLIKWLTIIAVSSIKEFERKMHLHVGHRTLDQLRCEERFRGWIALDKMMPQIKDIRGYT